MINIDKFYKQLDNKLQIINWIIDSKTKTGLKISDASFLTKERICELYNMEMKYFI